MPAKTKKAPKKEKAQEKIEAVEEVIEVKTSKRVAKPKEETKAKKELEAKPLEEPEKSDQEPPEEDTPETPDTKSPTIASFSELEKDKLPPSGEKEPPEEKKPEEKKEEEEEKEEVTTEETKKWLEDTKPGLEEEGTEDKGSKIRVLAVILLVAGIIAIIVGGIFYYRSKISAPEGEEEAEPVTVATETPTPTPIEEASDEGEEVLLADYSLSVLNGSGIPGEAGKVEGLLEEADFENIETGNAESYDYEQTEVSCKAETPDNVYTAIEEALGGEYDVIKSETILDEDATYDIIIIIGTRK